MSIVAIILWTVPASANDIERVLKADGPKNSQTLSQHIDFYQDASWEKTIEDFTGNDDDKFVSIQTPSPDFGFTQDRIWLRIKAVNKTQAVNTWYLYTHENFLQYYDVYIQRENGDILHVESHTPSSHFSERRTSFPQLATSFEFLPREQVAIFIAYSSGGSSKMSISLETMDSFAGKSVNQSSKVFTSYGMMVILMVMSFLGLIILRLRVISIYLLYVGVTLLFLMHGDGVAFQYFWPQYPVFNSYFSIIIGLAFTIVPYNFAREFLRTKTHHPIMDKILVTMMIVTPVIIIVCAFIDPQFTKKS